LSIFCPSCKQIEARQQSKSGPGNYDVNSYIKLGKLGPRKPGDSTFGKDSKFPKEALSYVPGPGHYPADDNVGKTGNITRFSKCERFGPLNGY